MQVNNKVVTHEETEIVLTYQEALDLFCKGEFYTPCNKWWSVSALESVIPPAWFPFASR